jgi:hypothetical protein
MHDGRIRPVTPGRRDENEVLKRKRESGRTLDKRWRTGNLVAKALAKE